jgi:hypothetical protein
VSEQKPPPNNEAKPGARKITAKRQAILAGAFAQLRKSRAKIEPTILQKIRDIVNGSPEIMKKLGVNEKDNKKSDEDMPLSAKKPDAEPKKAQPKSAQKKSSYEKIDQAKNMEVMAKLMELSPDNRDNIKAVIKKNQD